jgi:cardiolipin synthase
MNLLNEIEINLFLIVLYYLFIIGVCIKIILDTPTQSKALGYLFLVTFFPIGGVFIYFTLGVNYRKAKLYRKKLNIDAKGFKNLRDRVQIFTDRLLSKYEFELANFYPLAVIVSKEQNITTDNNSVQLLVNGNEKFKTLLTDLKNAKHHIHVQYYIYADDEIGNEIAAILIDKVKSGVVVRFMYDDFGSMGIKNLIKKLQTGGVEVAPFYKIIHPFFANRMNYRNHRKIVIIDGVVGYTGGINVSDKYINTSESDLFWRDTHLKIEGAAVMNLQQTFLADWNFCAEQDLGYTEELFPFGRENEIDYGNTLVQVSASGPDSEYPTIMYSMIQAIAAARTQILITTPYFIPEKSFMDALKIARLSGVEVHILVPGISDSIIVNAVSNSQYQELLDIGIRIYKYSKGFIHAKTMVCDGLVSFIGTANLDNRSFELNFEVNTVVYQEELANQLIHTFKKDIENADEIICSEWKNRPKYQIFMEQILRLFSAVM